MKTFSFLMRLKRGLRWGVVLMVGSLAFGCASAPQEAATDVFDLAANRPPTPVTLHAMARILAAQGRDRDCEYILTRALREDPTFLPAYPSLAESQLRLRRTDDAIATLRSGLKHAPKDAVLLNDLGMCFMLRGSYTDALAAFEGAVAAAPHDARFAGNRAAALGMIGRYDAALDAYLKIMPAADAHYNLGVLCEARQDTQRAEDEFRQAQALRGASRAAPGAAPAPATQPAGETPASSS